MVSTTRFSYPEIDTRSNVRIDARNGSRRESGIEPRPRVLLVESDAQFVDFLRLGFEYEGCEVASVASVAEALATLEQLRPDALVAEQRMPGISGNQLAALLRAKGCEAALMLLAAENSVDERVAGLEAGADDVMSKPISFKELLARVRAALRRSQSQLAHAQLAFEGILLDRRTRLVQRAGRSIELTPREFDLLDCFLRHPRQILPRDVLLAAVWGDDSYGDSNVLDVYVHTLREKLDDRPPRLLQTVRGLGYVLRAPHEARHAPRRASGETCLAPTADGDPHPQPLRRGPFGPSLCNSRRDTVKLNTVA